MTSASPSARLVELGCAEDAIHRLHDRAGLFVRQRIEDRLGFPPRGDEPARAQPGQMLRQRRLAQPRLLPKRPDRRLTLGQTAQDAQPMRVRHQRQHGSDVRGLLVERQGHR
ncbi:hypothetical protein SI859A1_01726 [Aurantimonas manganoxydans SI85-9A1]|uniref:Uncharacterized protein n=1 Tax=Aurantimonas manganoxydans (strain ATCC BAA-1229 / DSM 21871 / SI85-9A1) TaxID=287752 RepID=Q1YHV9_AURMS|nr:hypothetical protein SI859A1_01726 [Aurantimonas manganoxydans SI85-9A1]